jgi:hypothetical protein
VVFVLASVYMLYHIYRFTYVEPFLHPWNETNMVMVYDLFGVLNSVCQYFVENLCMSISIKNIDLQFLFLVASLLGFGMSAMLAS